MSIFLGVDGGGTKTEFVCIDAEGTPLARARTGTTYHLEVGMEEAVARLRQGIEDVCGQLSVSPADLQYAFFGLPAYGEDAVVDPLLDTACASLLGHGRFHCDNDMVCGWAGSLACADGINIVAGTGSIGYGENQGRKARVGGWGEVFSDEGSAYWIAIQGLNAFTRMSDGRLPEGPLRQVFLRELRLDADLNICARVMGNNAMTRGDIAGLARIVSLAAEIGDGAALNILRQAGMELAAMARALRAVLGFADEETVPLSWSGGVLTGQDVVRNAFTRALTDQGRYAIVTPRHDPGLGAALYAARIASR